jgi:hypothetical protein
MRALARSFALFLLLTAGMCPDKGPDFFGPGTNSPQLGNLTGTVLFGSTPLAGANVTLSGTPEQSMVTPASGVFSFPDLAVATYTITTTVSGYNCPQVGAVIERDKTANVDVQCTPVPGSVTGTVRVGGTPQGDVTVILRQAGTAIRTVPTASNGTYSITGIAPGPYSVEIGPPANTTCGNNPQNVTVISGQAVTANFDCTLIGGSISGTVTVDGQPRAGIAVHATAGSSTVSGVTQSDGTFTLGNLAPGAYAVSIDAATGTACSAITQSATVTAAQNTVVSFTCTTLPGSVSGVVSGLSGQTTTVTVAKADGTVVSAAATNIDGSYLIANIPPGSYKVTVTAPTGKTCSPGNVPVTVQANQTSSASFACQVLTFTVDLDASYRHVVPNVSSEVCVDFNGWPDAQYTLTWTGPGLVGTATRTGVADGDGDAFDRQAINVLGTYNVQITMTFNGVSVTNSVSVVVTPDPGTCPAPSSGVRAQR